MLGEFTNAMSTDARLYWHMEERILHLSPVHDAIDGMHYSVENRH